MVHVYRLWLKLITILSLVCLALSDGPPVDYQNDYEGELFVECKSGYGLSTVESRYTTGSPTGKRSTGADRLWKWQCVKV